MTVIIQCLKLIEIYSLKKFRASFQNLGDIKRDDGKCPPFFSRINLHPVFSAKSSDGFE